MAKKSRKLIAIKKMVGETGFIIIKNVGIDALLELREKFEDIEDTRLEPYVEHLLSDIVMINLLAVMARVNEWGEIAAFAQMKEDWLKKFLVLPHGIPSHDTIQRVMSMINGTVLYSCGSVEPTVRPFLDETLTEVTYCPLMSAIGCGYLFVGPIGVFRNFIQGQEHLRVTDAVSGGPPLRY